MFLMMWIYFYIYQKNHTTTKKKAYTWLGEHQMGKNRLLRSEKMKDHKEALFIIQFYLYSGKSQQQLPQRALCFKIKTL